MKHFAFTCQGESHKAIDKPCQDFSYSSAEDGLSVAIVCDGHGGERYFRSDIGSRLCTEITAEAIKLFVADIDEKLFVGKPFTQRKAVDEMDSIKLNNTDLALRQLFSSIIATWNQEILTYTNQHPATEDEIAKVQSKYIEKFQKGESLEKTYGCTLMAYVQTPKYWVAFHLGDGKCVSFHEDESLWQEPVEWDERCFLNKTTSICDSDALNEFRYTYCGDGTFPVAVYLGSDGMDDSFGPMENLVEFYMQVIKMLARDNDMEAQKSIEETLPMLSKRGSQDDMSLAYVYDERRLGSIVTAVLESQIEHLKNSIRSLKNAIANETTKLNTLRCASDRNSIIERNYAHKNITRLTDRLNNETKKLKIRLVELHPERYHTTNYGRRYHSRVPSKRLLNKQLRFSKNRRNKK